MELNESLPLSEAEFHILLSMSQEPRHGYAVIKDIEILSNGRVRLSTGTLYGAISRFLEQGWIARVDDIEQERDGRERKYYSLTQLGMRLLEAEVERLQSLVTAAQLRALGEEV